MSTDSHGHNDDPARNPGRASGSGDNVAPMAGARQRRRSEGVTKAPPRRRRKARRVHRVVHHLDIWSLAKVGSIYVACGFVVMMISGFILWRAADLAGTIDGVEGFMEDTGGYDSFVMRGDVVFSSALVIGAVLGILTVCMIILAGILFNLISDLTGGIRLTVIDEDLLVTPARRTRSAQDLAAAASEEPNEPRYDEPRYDEPRYDDPVEDDPVDDDPVEDDPGDEASYDEPQYGGSRYDEPQYGEPRYDEPQYNESRYGESRDVQVQNDLDQDGEFPDAATTESPTYEPQTHESPTYESPTYESQTYESQTYEPRHADTTEPVRSAFTPDLPTQGAPQVAPAALPSSVDRPPSVDRPAPVVQRVEAVDDTPAAGDPRGSDVGHDAAPPARPSRPSSLPREPSGVVDPEFERLVSSDSEPTAEAKPSPTRPESTAPSFDGFHLPGLDSDDTGPGHTSPGDTSPGATGSGERELGDPEFGESDFGEKADESSEESSDLPKSRFEIDFG